MARPFDRLMINIVDIYIDFIALIVSLSHVIFITSPEESDGIGKFIIIAIITAIIATLSLGFVNTLIRIKEWWQNRKIKIHSLESRK